MITEEDLWEGVPAPSREQPAWAAKAKRTQSLKKATEDLEREMIGAALQNTRNNQQQAARISGCTGRG